jgi:hypothetical protein
MTSVPVQIILHGLMAVVPLAGPDGANHAVALLVEARNNPAHVDCFAQHTPMVTFVTSSTECTADPGSGCSWAASRCQCELSGQEIELLPDAEPVKSHLDERPARHLPSDSKMAGNFAYLGNLRQLGSPVDQRFLKPDPLPPALRAKLAARFRFPFRSLVACNLATRHENGADYVHSLNFRKLNEKEQEGEVSRALAQQVVANVSVPIDDGAGQQMVLRLRPLSGNTGSVRTFTLKRSGTVVIQLMNDRPKLANPKDRCDDGIGHDFAFLYELTANPPPWPERKLPHVNYKEFKSFTDLVPDDCKIVKNPESRPICPMGTSYP